MWKCQKCGKPVYFAERKQSLGFDWHPYCLKCEECGKVLTPGQHAEHAGGPFCHIPCYAALFGPKLFGHGSTTESHRSFGRREASFVREKGELENKVEKFNQFYAEKPRAQVSSRQVNGRLLLEGVLTIYWGTECSVRLKEFGDNRLIARQRKAMSLGFQFEDVALAPVVKGLEEENRKIEDEEEVEVEEDPPALPYFDPSTHPLANTAAVSGNLEDMTDLLPSAALNNQDQEDSDLEDLDTEGFLSYDPLHKWQTLTSLCPPTSSSPAPPSSPPPDVSATLKPEALVRRSFSERLNGAGPLAIPGLVDLSSPSKTLPASLSSITDDLDELLAVERKLSEHERVYHTVSGGLPVQKEQEQGQKKEEQEGVVRAIEELVRNNVPPGESLAQENLVGKRFLVEKCPEDSCTEQLRDRRANSAPVPEAAPVPAPDSPVQLRQKPVFQLGSYQPRPAPAPVAKLPSKDVDNTWEPPGSEERKGGPRVLRRRPGKKMARQAKLCRRSSINGHWYDRETSVFLPPKHSPMSVYTSSLATHAEVLQALLAKYKVEADPGDFALYLVNETGERRLLGETEFPLLLRIRTGPHEEIAKLYLMDKRRTEEITHQVAAFLRFSYAELRSFLNMFYEEEEGEADRIRTKYLLLRRRLQRQVDLLRRNDAVDVINS